MLLICSALLLLSHLMTDFYLQTDDWVRLKVERKHKSWHLYLHALIAGVLAYLATIVTGGFGNWWVVGAIAIPHFLIDLWKINQKGSAVYFIIDQCLHILNLLIVITILFTEELQLFSNPDVWFNCGMVVLAALILWQPSGILIGKLTEPYREELEEEDKSKSLPDAGQAIGILERLFILILILLSEFSAIGFLIAAKSILRYSDHKKVKNPIRMSEYVIIGTLMSFLIAIIIGLACKYLLSMELFT